MEVAILHYQERWGYVSDVSAQASYDLHCTGGGKELHVEVKGTIFVAERAVHVAEAAIVTAAAGGDDFSDFDDFDFSGGGNKASARR